MTTKTSKSIRRTTMRFTLPIAERRQKKNNPTDVPAAVSYTAARILAIANLTQKWDSVT